VVGAGVVVINNVGEGINPPVGIFSLKVFADALA
jgi:hypothetical protein